MKKIILSAVLSAAVAISSYAFAATDQIETSANLNAGLSVSVDQGLSFGNITRTSGSQGTQNVVLNHIDDSLGGSCGSTLVCSDGHAAVVRVYGFPNANYTTSFSNTTALTTPGSSVGLIITNITFDASNRLDTNGYSAFYVGGTAQIPADAIPGPYSGTIDITVNYP